MGLFYRDTFDRPSDGELDDPPYVALTGGDWSGSSGFVYEQNRCRFDSVNGHAGFYFSYEMPVPNWAMECTITLESITHLGAIYLLGRYEAATGRHYAVVLSVSSDAANTYVFDQTVTSPEFAANKIYIVSFDGTNATILATASFTFALDTDYRVRMDLLGSRLGVYINGVGITAVTNKSSVDDSWGYGTWGLACGMIGSGSGSGLFDVDDLMIEVAQSYVAAFVGCDEVRRLLRFAVPTGSSLPGGIYNYHLVTGDWTVDDRHVTCLAEILTESGERHVLEAHADDGKVYEIDGSADLAGSAIDAEWESNWIEIGDKDRERVLERVQVLIAQAKDLEIEVTLTVTSDPSDPRTYVRTVIPSGWMARDPVTVNLLGRFAKIGLRHAALTGELRVRRVSLDVLA